MLRQGAAAARSLRRFYSAGADRPFDKILIANRGEIACRVMRTAKRLGVKTVAVYSEADARSMHVRMADEAFCIGSAQSKDSYLRMDRIMDVVAKTKAQAIHPGYGFLSENAKFANMVEEAGVAFLGPTGRSMDMMGDKLNSKKIAIDAKVSTIPGFQGEVRDENHAVELANGIGYPVMIKASAGGGGKGMRIAHNDAEVREGFRLSKSEALSSFGDDRMLIERFIEDPHHIEIQVLADSFGNVVAFPERECSVQRRNQKVIEESPSCLIDPVTRAAMHEQARMLCKAVQYRSAGTIEMLCDGKKNFYFLEMNTRLQVEHPVTELVSGEDLVEHMLWIGAGRPLPQKFIDNPSAPIHGWAMESRVYAEDPLRRFLPAIGPLSTYKEPQTFIENGLTVRLDTGVYEGGEISMFYDPMIAKLCTHAPDRATAIQLQEDALDRYVIRGLGNNTNFLRACYRNKKFRDGDYGTGFIPQEFPHGFHGVELTADETAELISYAAMIHRSRHMLRTSELSEPTSEDLSTFVVVLGGLKGQAYQVSFNDDYSSESVQVSILRLADEHHAKPAHPGRKPATSATAHVKHYHRGTKPPCEIGQSTEVVLSGMSWQAESALAEFTVEIDKSKLDKAKSTRAAAASAEESDILSEKEEVVQYEGLTKSGYMLRYKGNDQEVIIRTLEEHKVSRYMLEPEVKDNSKFVLCPMPGTVISVKVAEGQTVMEGQEIAVVEAMKMQNVLKSPRDGIIKAVKAKPGDALRVDQVIVEFLPGDVPEE